MKHKVQLCRLLGREKRTTTSRLHIVIKYGVSIEKKTIISCRADVGVVATMA
jgi:hypothetical protein